jgi:hypothetical protein
MRRLTTLALTAPALGLMTALAIGAPASAGSATAQAYLQPINDPNASGEAFVDVQGNKITVTMAATGLVPDQPHAAHIHFGDDARHECPTFAMDDTHHDHRLATLEGVPAYGPVAVSLTEFGATDPGTALAIERFDTAPEATSPTSAAAPKSPVRCRWRSSPARPSSSSTACSTTTRRHTTTKSRPTSTRACRPRPRIRPSAACSR